MNSEIALLRAVRDALRDYMELDEREIDIDADEMAPTEVGQRYFCIIPGGWTAGPVHNTSGGTVDEIHSLDVAVVMRIPEYPRDKESDSFLGTAGTLNVWVQKIKEAIDFQYDTLNAANTILQTEYGLSAGEGFKEPLKVAGVGKIATVPGPFFADIQGERRAGLSRRVFLRGARYLAYRTQL